MAAGVAAACAARVCATVLDRARWAIEMPAYEREAVIDRGLEARVIDLAAGAANRHKAGDPRVDRLHPAQQPLHLGDITDELGSREDVSPAQAQSNAFARLQIQLPA